MAAFLLVLFAILNRVFLASGSHAPHAWWNFTAVGGSLLFFGARRPLREMWMPVLALMATDYLLTTRMYGYAFHPADYAITWGWYAAALLLGAWLLKGHANAGRIIGASFAGASSFFLISNFALLYPATMYPHNFAGVVSAYAAGLPFYRNDLASTLLVAGIAFSAAAFARQHRDAKARVTA